MMTHKYVDTHTHWNGEQGTEIDTAKAGTEILTIITAEW